MPSVMITGSRGYIGSVLCHSLRRNGYEIIEFDSVLGHDVTNLKEVRSVSEKAWCIVHLAGIVGFGAVEKDPDFARKVNVEGTVNVASCGKRVIFASVLGRYDGYSVIDESTPFAPKHEYFVQKLDAEGRVLRVKPSSSGIGNVVLRFGTLYGVSECMRWDLLVHNLILEGLREGRIQLYQPDVIRPVTDIRDAVSAIMFFVSTSAASGGVYNVVSQNIAKKDIVRIIADSVPEVSGYDTVPEEDYEKRDYVALTEKICSLGFKFNGDFAGSVEEIANLARKGSVVV